MADEATRLSFWVGEVRLSDVALPSLRVTSLDKGEEEDPINWDKRLKSLSWKQMTRCFHVCKDRSVSRPKQRFRLPVALGQKVAVEKPCVWIWRAAGNPPENLRMCLDSLLPDLQHTVSSPSTFR